MKSDVKAIRKTDATLVFGGRTRLRGIILSSTGSAGSVTLQDGNSVTQFQVDVPAGDVFSYNLAEDGILFVKLPCDLNYNNWQQEITWSNSTASQG